MYLPMSIISALAALLSILLSYTGQETVEQYEQTQKDIKATCTAQKPGNLATRTTCEGGEAAVATYKAERAGSTATQEAYYYLDQWRDNERATARARYEILETATARAYYAVQTAITRAETATARAEATATQKAINRALATYEAERTPTRTSTATPTATRTATTRSNNITSQHSITFEVIRATATPSAP